MKRQRMTVSFLAPLSFFFGLGVGSFLCALNQGAPIPNLSEVIGGVTIAVLTEPPRFGDVPPGNISGPTVDQTLQWMAETAPQNSSPETSDDYRTAIFIVPGSTYSETVFASVYYPKTKFTSAAGWTSVDFGGSRSATHSTRHRSLWRQGWDAALGAAVSNRTKDSLMPI